MDGDRNPPQVHPALGLVHRQPHAVHRHRHPRHHRISARMDAGVHVSDHGCCSLQRVRDRHRRVLSRRIG